MQQQAGETAVIDLRECGALPPHTYAFYQLRELQPGETCEVLVEEEPGLLMESVAHQLRHAIHWEVVQSGPPLWRVRVRHRDDTEAASLRDLLEREHVRLDGLFAQAMHAAGRGDLAAAEQHLREFGVGLRRHIRAENDLLAPAFTGPRDPHGADPTSIMIREHEEILQQLGLLEELFAGSPSAAEVMPFFGLLSGMMAKHEGREEQNLFPQWQNALRRAPAGSENALLERVRAILDGRDDA